MKYAVEMDVYDIDKPEKEKKKGCTKINVELKCKSRGCGTFNSCIIAA